jgi:hypothetical protein
MKGKRRQKAANGLQHAAQRTAECVGGQPGVAVRLPLLAEVDADLHGVRNLLRRRRSA